MMMVVVVVGGGRIRIRIGMYVIVDGKKAGTFLEEEMFCIGIGGGGGKGGEGGFFPHLQINQPLLIC